MSVSAIKTRLALIQKQISGVKRAYAEGPASLPQSDLPLFVNFTGPATEDWQSLGADYDQENRQYLMRLYVKPWGQGIDGEAERLCEPFFERVRDKFSARPGLGTGTNGTQLLNIDAALLGDQGVSRMIYAEEEFIGIEFRLMVTEVVKRQYDAGE